MSSDEASSRSKGDNLDLLKSILETDQTEDTGFVSSSVSNSGRSSRMGDDSTQSDAHVTLSMPTTKERKNHRSDSERSDLPDSRQNNNTLHLKHGINYTPLVHRDTKSPRKITNTATPQKVTKSRRVDPLVYKYAELQAMLSDEGGGLSQGRPTLNPQLTKKAQQLMFEYKLAQSGHLPVSWLNAHGVSLPNIAPVKGKGRKSRFPRGLHTERQTLNFASQTVGSEDEYGDDSYVLIDATNTNDVKTRRVTFANPRRDGGDVENVYSSNDPDGVETEPRFRTRRTLRARPHSAPTAKIQPAIKRKPRKVQSGIRRAGKKSPQTASTPPKPKTFLAAKKSSPRSRTESESSAKSPPRGRKSRKDYKSSTRSDSKDSDKTRSKSRSRSSSRESGSKSGGSSSSGSRRYGSLSSSESRSRSPKVKLDNNLKTTENDRIKEWLKEKDKEYKKMKKEKRKEARRRLKKKQEEEERRQQQLEKSKAAFHEWMLVKKREEKERQRKKEEERANHKQSVDSTTSHRSEPSFPVSKKEKGRNLERARDDGHLRSQSMKSKQQLIEPSTLSRPKIGFKRQRKPKEVRENQTATTKDENKRRISYDEWVASKRKQDEENMKKAVREKEQMRKFDPGVEEKEERVNRMRQKSARTRSAGNKPEIEEPSETKQENTNRERPKRKVFRKKANSDEKKKPEPEIDFALPPIGTKALPPRTPKPEIVTERKQKVKYAQESWDGFSDYVWTKLNENEGDLERPEPQGSDNPDVDPVNERKDTTDETNRDVVGFMDAEQPNEMRPVTDDEESVLENNENLEENSSDKHSEDDDIRERDNDEDDEKRKELDKESDKEPEKGSDDNTDADDSNSNDSRRSSSDDKDRNPDNGNRSEEEVTGERDARSSSDEEERRSIEEASQLDHHDDKNDTGPEDDIIRRLVKATMEEALNSETDSDKL